MNHLENWLHKLIREKGPLSFRDFMYWSLYHPEWGYYTRTQLPFGKQGDFYTAPGVHAVFGETIAQDLIAKWRQLGEPNPFLIVEFGAGQGFLARDILNGLDKLAPSVNISYHIIEISPNLRQLQLSALTGRPVVWISNLEELGQFSGVVLSNELLDAFPVHVITAGKHGVQECFVAIQDNQFVEEFKNVTDRELLEYIEQYLPGVLTGQDTSDNLERQNAADEPAFAQKFEINRDAQDWLQDVSAYLTDGFVITIDYGEETGTLYQGRPHGSLRGFKQHQVSDDFYSSVGERDLTADINFTALISYGEQLGLQTEFYGTQAKYLIQAGILNHVNEQASLDPFQPGMKQNLAIKQLIMPGSFGERFKVLIQRKARA